MRVLRRTQRTLFDAMFDQLLAQHGPAGYDPMLKQLDGLLDDDDLLQAVHDALGRRYPLSRRRGRHSTPTEVVLRMLVLQRLFQWTFDALEREVCGSFQYRHFTKIGMGKVPDAKTLIRLSGCLGEQTLKSLHERVVHLARQRGMVRAKKMRLDTTVVETNVHYPTDSTLLSDGVRVITRTIRRMEALGRVDGKAFRERLRSVKYRVLEIARSVRSRIPQPARMRKAYERLFQTVRAVVRDARAAINRACAAVKGTPETERRLSILRRRAEHFVTLTERVLRQAHARVIGQNTHFGPKLLSMFEQQTELIRKGKRSKPTEFGNVVKIQEAENQIVTDFEVYERRPSDAEMLLPSIEKHRLLFGRAPTLVAADSAFYTAANEQGATALGVSKLAIPNRRTRSPARRAFERQRWFRRAQKWRTGCEGRISVLKRRHGLTRCRYHGMQGMVRWVGWGVIADNLIKIARFK